MEISTRHTPLSLCPDNPHYFFWRGKPVIIIGSGEHYGAVLNRRFDYVKYLDTLANCGLNHTRLFTGLYVEDNAHLVEGPQAGNSLDPLPGDLLCPFARSDIPGYGKGGNKFDLKRWDEAFFIRLKDFIGKASDRGVIVEVNLFCPYYSDQWNQWKLSPLNVVNNVNGFGDCRLTDVFTLDRSGDLLAVEESLTRRIVEDLRDFDNIYYEICNEPYPDCGGVTMEWQHHIADVIVDTEKQYLHKHLISQNIAVFKSLITEPHPAVSIFTFHYACPPDAVAVNYRLNKPIGDNENGFRGIDDAPYRHEAWAFIFAGGALFSHLDYSFTVGHEDGSFTLPTKQCGGGTPALREQFRHLKEFIEGFCFIAMKPDNTVIRSCVALVSLREVSKYIGGLWFDSVNNAARAAVVFAYPLVETGKQYAIYVRGGTRAELSLFLPKGRYVASWFHPCNGRTEPADIFNHEEGERLFITPAYEEDIALSIRRSGSITHTGDRS